MYSLVLSVSRTVNVIWMNYKVSYRALASALLGIMVLWGALVSMELYLTVQGLYCRTLPGPPTLEQGTGPPGLEQQDHNSLTLEELFVMPLIGKEIVKKLQLVLGLEESLMFELILLQGLPFILPSCLAVVCLFITAWQLMSKPCGRRSRVSRRITTTIVYLTLVFVCCNVPNFIVLVVLGHPDISTATHATVVLRFTTSTIAPGVSAVLLPLILIVRGHEIRDFVRNAAHRSLARRAISTVVSVRSLELARPGRASVVAQDAKQRRITVGGTIRGTPF